jgi:hypothetical protein
MKKLTSNHQPVNLPLITGIVAAFCLLALIPAACAAHYALRMEENSVRSRVRMKLLFAFLLSLPTAGSVAQLQAATITFSGLEQLGNPTDTSITINVVP